MWNNHPENCWRFVNSFMKPGSSLKFLKYLELVIPWLYIYFQIPEISRSEFLKYLESVGSAKIKDSTHTSWY
jgi:hypothetical protein